MAKKRVKKAMKAKKVKRVKKVIKVRARKPVKAKKLGRVKTKEKVLGRVEHFFDKISVAAISVKAPFKVGDILHIKGHTTDFFQRVESMQIEHQDVLKVKKGDDIGIKVKEFAREHDFVYLGSEKDLAAKPPTPAAAKGQNAKPVFQTTIFKTEKQLTPPAAKTNATQPKLTGEKKDPYSNTKFLNF